LSPEKETLRAHITEDTALKPAIHAWTYYLDDQGCSQHTIKAFAADLRLLASFLPPDAKLGDISVQDLNQFLEWMQKRRGVSCSPKTLSRRITSLKAFFRWLFHNGIIDADPAELIIQRSVISPLPVVLTMDEVQGVLEAAQTHRRSTKPDTRYYTLLKLLLDTGIKKSECLALHPNHIDLETSDGAILFVRYANPQYRYKERKIPLSAEWVEAYHEYKAQYAAQYVPIERFFPWSQRRLEYLLEDLSREAGLEKHLSFDMCRWTCALLDWQAGEEQNKIRQKLGVSKIQWREVGMKLRRLAGEPLGVPEEEQKD